MKRLISVLLALTAILSLSACDGKGGEPGTSVAPESTTQAIGDLQVTAYDLQQANSIHNLLSVYKSVSVTDEVEGGTYTENFFQKRAQPVFLSMRKDENGAVLFEGWYEGYEFYLDDGTMHARLDINKMTETPTFPYDARLSDYFNDVTVQLAEAGEDTYTFNVENAERTYTNIITVDKETLAIQKVVCRNPDCDSFETNVRYDAYVEGIELLDGWSGNYKTVTIVSDIVREDGKSNVTVQKHIPGGWELIPYAYEETALYLDADSTVEYQYPGDDKDYTVYITNIMG